MLRNGVIALSVGFRIAEAFREQLPGAFDGVLLFCNVVATVIEQACQRFAGGVPVHTVLYAVRQTRHQRGALTSPCASMMAS